MGHVILQNRQDECQPITFFVLRVFSEFQGYSFGGDED